MNLIDLTGKKFGRLTVIRFDHSKLRANSKGTKTGATSFWFCRCDCGKETVASMGHLKTGHTKSCGCYRRERAERGLEPGQSGLNRLYLHYRSTAKRRSLEFDLSKKEFEVLTKKECYYCGSEPKTISKNECDRSFYVYNGVDRIDSSRGYLTENVVTCCAMCNSMKSNHTQQEFFEQIKRIATKWHIVP